MNSCVFDRLATEATQLEGRLARLQKFLLTPLFQDLAVDDQQDLSAQLYAMRLYYDVLVRRIARNREA